MALDFILIDERYRKRENIGYPQIYESLKIELRYKRKISSDDLLMYKGIVSTTLTHDSFVEEFQAILYV